jgi:hypothetical protein
MNDIVKRTLEMEASLKGLTLSPAELSQLFEEKGKEDMKKIGENLFPSPPLALLSFDVDKIKEYVFATSRPIEIKGGSDILESLTEKGSKDGIYAWLKKLGIPEDNVIFAGGGSGLVLLPASKAEEATKAIEEGYKRATITATCTAVYELFYPHELIYGKDIEYPLGDCGGKYFDKEYIERIKNGERVPFGKIVKLLSFKLRHKKEERALRDLSPASYPPFLRLCTSCGLYPATKEEERDEEEVEYLCASCFNKRKVAWAMKERRMEALSLEEIVEMEDGERDDIALIYADLCETGSLLEKAETMEDLKALSKALMDAIKKSILEIVREHNLRKKYQAPVIGGDDIVLIIPARYTVSVVCMLLEEIKSNLQREGDKMENISEELKRELRRLRLAVGFLTASHTFPIHYLFNYVQSLLRNAKAFYYREKKRVDWIDFLRLKAGSPLNIELDKLREQERKKGIERDVYYYLTMCPYRIEEFKKLINALEMLKSKIHSSQLHNILQLLNDHPFAAWINIIYQVLRNQKDWGEVMEKLTGSIDDYSAWANFFVHKRDNNYYTRFIDLMDLYKVSRKGES